MLSVEAHSDGAEVGRAVSGLGLLRTGELCSARGAPGAQVPGC